MTNNSNSNQNKTEIYRLQRHGTKKELVYKVNTDLFTEEDFLKDCPNSKFVPTILPPAKRIIAIGDIHGDINLARKSLKLANLIDDNDEWIAEPKNTIVVQVGDQIDSCRPIPGVYDCHNKKLENDSQDDINVLNFFDKIRKKAISAGGEIYSLLGNHELMNAQGNFNYVSYDNFYEFKYTSPNGTMYEGPSGRASAFIPGGPISSQLACNRMSVLVIGSNMFIHAGILPILVERLEYLNIDHFSKLKYLNAIVRKWLLAKLSDISEKESSELFINNNKLSPFWTRVYGSIPENTNINSNECFTSVKKILQVFKIGRIIVGHTPQLFTNNDGINGTCYEKSKHNNRLYRIDGGFSRAFNIFDNKSLVQVLEILNDNTFNILTDSIVSEDKIPVDINISDEEMKKISYIYSQNRTSRKTNSPKNNHKRKKGYNSPNKETKNNTSNIYNIKTKKLPKNKTNPKGFY